MRRASRCQIWRRKLRVNRLVIGLPYCRRSDPPVVGVERARSETGAAGGRSLAPMLRLLYYVYARRLARDVKRRAMPCHVGIILDGNRRHGRSLGITEPRELYDLGAEKLDDVLDWCAEFGIPTVTLWVFSTDNFQRPPAEVSGILGSIEAKLTALACDPAIHRRRVRVRAIGSLAMLPEPVLAAIIEEISPESIASHLYTAGLPDPDLIIRTSGEIRLSGFLLWQSAHSEFYFTDAPWPAFRKIDFLRAIRSFQQRRRRFGC